MSRHGEEDWDRRLARNECFDLAQHERKISDDFDHSSVRPFDKLRAGSEDLEG
jgi:hypothetical protein